MHAHDDTQLLNGFCFEGEADRDVMGHIDGPTGCHIGNRNAAVEREQFKEQSGSSYARHYFWVGHGPPTTEDRDCSV